METELGKKGLAPQWKKTLRRLWWLLLFPFIFILTNMAARHPAHVEQVYALGVFPIVSSAVEWVFGRIPFSFAEILLYALLALLVLWIAVTIVKAAKKKLCAQRLVSTLISYALVVAVAMNAFYFLWGFNYYRLPVAATMGLDVKERSPEQLYGLCAALADAAGELRATLPEDEEGVFMLSRDTRDMLAEIPGAYAALGKDYPQYGKAIPPAKPLIASEAMSWAGLSGIFIPFTEEANINAHQPDLLLPATAAHESAHMEGVAREDEANFIGYLACIHSDDPEIVYSGVVLALIHAGNALADISPQAYARLRATYSDAVDRDLAAHAAYWDSYEGETKETVEQINDNYLKQQGQGDGVLSYGRMVDLLLAYYFKLR